MRKTKKHIWSAFLAMAAFALPTAQNTAVAQTINNVATAEWDVGGQRLQRPSNQVSIPVVPLPAEPPKISTFRFDNPPGGEQVSIPATQCRGTGGDVPVQLRGVFAGTSTSPGSITPTTGIKAGEPLVVSVISTGNNLNPSQIDQFDVTLITPGGDREQISVTETAVNSARFVGMINTVAAPPAGVAGDCVLSVSPGATLKVELRDGSGTTVIASVDVDILIDPFGIVFDSGDGQPVSGTRVTLVDADTGQPATVFGDDGVSSFPSTIIAGSTVTDSSGRVYNFGDGFYRFPFARPGRYRLLIVPPSPYTFPSNSTPADLAGLRRPDGQPFTIADGSYGGIIVLDDPAPVRIDVPLDRPGEPITLTKTVSKGVAQPGDVLQYRITVRNTDVRRSTGRITVQDTLPPALRLRTNTVRYQGNLVTPTTTPDGRQFTVSLPPLAPSATGVLTYLTEVRPDAKPGNAVNQAQASDNRGTRSGVVDSAVRITRDDISDRFTIIGRISDGGCTIDSRGALGIGRVRVFLEDGRYTVTDDDGRYHFEGVKPGLHVVQVDPESFPLDLAPIDCAQNTRSAGSDISRFVEGRGGALKRVNFSARKVAAREQKSSVVYKKPEVLGDPEAAGAGKDWFTGQSPGIGWLFPAAGHNPRVKAIRVAIKHGNGHTVELTINGKPVNPLAFDGQKKSANGMIRVSVWRGIELQNRSNLLVARVLNRGGKLVEELRRNVHYSISPLNAEFIKEKSLLVADGVTRPVVAVRLTDRDGKPVHHGVVGDFSIPAPYAPAVEVDAQQARQLSGLERAKPVWRVQGDDGIAYIELEPTTASGTVSITFPFRDGETSREQRIETWLEPGNRPWTVVGFAAGTVGFNSLSEGLEELVDDKDNINLDGRVALYAKGRVTGKWLMTLAYDTDKKEDETQLTGVIDPRRYYTIYADRSEQRYDAASVRRLYLKLERPQFYALFGDYQTGIDEPQLARYQRSFNGIKAEFRNDRVSATAFGADTPHRFRREEIQGNGLTGPYALASRDVLANSERITLETRDRLRSNLIIETRQLTRHIDYDIYYLAGTLRFREPILSRGSGLNPQFIIAEYEVLTVGERVTNAGGRVTWKNEKKNLQIGATAIHNETNTDRTDLLGVDIRYRPDLKTEIRAELASSRNHAKSGQATPGKGSAKAWLVEAEHHSSKFDVLAYVREQEAGFGVGQLNGGESGTRKFGVDGRVRLNDKLSIALAGYQENFLATNARRRAATGELQWKSKNTSVRAGVLHAEDRLADGTINRSTLAQLGVTQRLLDNKLELDAQTEVPISDQNESIDFPARHRVTARYSITSDVQVVGSYEIANGENIDARTARIGFDVKPWAGGRFVASANQQEITEYGPRSFAAYGFSQSVQLSEKWSADFSLDGNKTLNGFNRVEVVNPAQPVASGGFLGSDGTLTQDFTAVTAGATYRSDDWSWATRAEYRAGDTTDRYGITSAVLKQIGDGSALGGVASYFKAKQDGGATTETLSAELSWAHRPVDSEWSWLNKLELTEDKVRNAVAGQAGPIGGAALTVNGDVTSRRIINSFSINYSPEGDYDGEFLRRGEYGLFWGTRYVFDKFGQDDVEGWSNVVGADIKFDLNDKVDVGASGTVRIGTNARTIAYSGGPSIGVTPAKNTYISLGYNFVGFDDRDFNESRYTRSGPYITFRLKFDQRSLADLGR